MGSYDNSVQCEIFYNPNRDWLANAWQQLELNAQPNIFLSWLWIGSWLDCFIDDFYLIEARYNQKVVGLGILVARKSKYPLNSSKNYFLHRTGDNELDQAWIEYNDFLLLPELAEITRNVMMSKIMHSLTGKGTFVVGASLKEVFDGASDLGVEQRSAWETMAYKLDLDELRENNRTLEQSISRSGRYQIKRSMRKYEDKGKITISTATTPSEALQMFSIAEPFHIKRWGNRLGQSGFVNAHFKRFHRTLIERGVNNGNVVFHHICVGGETLAVIYNFYYGNTVYFYLSALNYEYQDKHLKPGLVAHYLLIKKALSEGMVCYDFMGGITRYKKTFANRESCLAVLHYQHPQLALKVENTIRDLKRRLTAESSLHYS